MDDPRREILERYEFARATDPTLTKGEYMQMISPGTYQTEESGARAFRKLEANEISGSRILGRQYGIRHYKETPESRRRRRKDKYAEREYTASPLEHRRGGFEYGLWKVILTIEYTDELGEQQQIERSYIVTSELDSNLDIPLIYAGTVNADERYQIYWGETGSAPNEREGTIIGKRVVRIERTNIEHPYNLGIVIP